jgi:hypothetical protein
VRLPRRPGPDGDLLAPQFTVSGHTIVFHVGTAIYALDVRQGGPEPVARAAGPPIGLSIVGGRIAWAENKGHNGRIREATLAH